MASIYSPDEAESVTAQDRHNRKRPAGYRWLSVLLPQQVFNHLHIQARLSDMSFQRYMQEFCSEAWPYNTKNEPAGTMAAQASPSPQK
jgi:hypothetical protein